MDTTLSLNFPLLTDRLLLAPYKKEHIEPFFKLNQLPETHRYNYTQPYNKDEAGKHVEEFINYDYTKPAGRCECAVLLKESHKFIGYAGFKAGELAPGKTIEIYYTLHRDHFGLGYATELVQEMLRFGFQDVKLHRIWAGATVENKASWRVMEKNGMRRECHWIKDRPLPGQWIEGKGFEKTGKWEDGYGYAIVESEFLK